MMTSYFANWRMLQNPVSIAARPPFWFTGPRMFELAPEESLLFAYHAGSVTIDEYVEMFLYNLNNNYDPMDIYRYIVDKFGDNAELLCYERPGQFCHRRIVADWISSAIQLDIPEAPNNRGSR